MLLHLCEIGSIDQSEYCKKFAYKDVNMISLTAELFQVF